MHEHAVVAAPPPAPGTIERFAQVQHVRTSSATSILRSIVHAPCPHGGVSRTQQQQQQQQQSPNRDHGRASACSPPPACWGVRRHACCSTRQEEGWDVYHLWPSHTQARDCNASIDATHLSRDAQKRRRRARYHPHSWNGGRRFLAIHSVANSATVHHHGTAASTAWKTTAQLQHRVKSTGTPRYD